MEAPGRFAHHNAVGSYRPEINFAEHMANSFRKKPKENFVIRFSLFLGFFLLFPFTGVSASSGTFSIEPIFTDIRLESEGERNFSLEVGNQTTNPIVFRISFVDFGSLGESGGVAFLGNGVSTEHRYGLASWLSAEKDVVTVLPQTKETIHFTVENKESLSPGGHYAAVLFRAEKEGADQGTTISDVSITPDLTALIFVQKTGGAIEELQYRDSALQAVIFGIPEKWSERFQNSGNVHLTPRGVVEVRDMLGRVVRRGILNEESGIILPESYRVYPITLKPLEKAIIPGFYTVSARYRFDGQDVFTTIPEKRVFAWRILLLWIFFLVILAVLLRKLFVRKKSKEL